ncbi:protein-tyrosine phosphatase-like protein [Mycena alexandri]|uniref:Protein-tyrosine phosphatase-like protein n=1 Tax=Mycena alexandri TaxID=1745969 RepID=A0AAD6X8E9_9AGAR|nr:protein-tyrosine phosphatase-like protein [Mycena alexandri]
MSLLVLPAPVEFASEFPPEFASFPPFPRDFANCPLFPRPPSPPPPPVLPPVFLASLASQHHLSAYNTSKYGPQGCPIRYIPLSVHLPDHVRELEARQRIASAAQAWWPCESPQEPSPLLLGPCGMPVQDSTSLRDQLEAAMQDHLSAATPAPVPLKTSSTHPINISAIIPFELIPLISSHLLLSAGPTLFDIPPAFALDRLTAAQHHDNTIPRLPPPPPPPSTQMVVTQLRSRSDVSEALKAAINTAVAPVPALPTLHSNSSTLSLSLTVTVALTEKTAPPPPEPAFTIGNIFLSSCPGKKVRLQGPVKGRSGVCRDLHADMRRMKDLGVGCIVCCLDDAELEFLGAPWHLYERAAKAVGISVLRIPTPEGLAPPSPAALDAHLTQIINAYTLHGVPILVHCRGGVGRAGVVACCWMLKLGLCGWLGDGLATPAGGVRLDAVELVERVISIARRRRSVKAVETYEQVQFLVDFVEYLRSKPSTTE